MSDRKDSADWEVWAKWRQLVNMTEQNLSSYYKSDEGEESGLDASEANSAGIDHGRASARMLMKMIPTGKTWESAKKNWTASQWFWARKQNSFISRMRGNEGPLEKDGKKTRKHMSLLIWGHDPTKSLNSKPAKPKVALLEPWRDEHWMFANPTVDEVCIMATLPLELGLQFPKSRGGNDTSAPHCTVLYIGKLEKRRVPDFVEILKRVCSRFKPFECSLGELFYFNGGKHGFPAVLKVHSRTLAQFQSKLKSSLQAAGFVLEDKWPDFRPHATLEYVPEKNGYVGTIPRGSWTVRTIDVYGLDLSIPLGTEQCLSRPLPSWKSDFESLVANGAPSSNRSDL